MVARSTTRLSICSAPRCLKTPRGAFVTTGGYTKKAREAAEKEGFKRIGLINGEQLVGILDEQYERLSLEMRERLGMRRALVPE